MPIQFSDMQDFFRNSFMSCFPPFYTTTIIQLSRCPYLQLITRSIILLFLHFIENSQNWQKLPMMIEFARATEWILYLTPHIQSRYKIKNLAKILAPEYIFLKILVFFDQNKGEIYERLLLFLKKWKGKPWRPYLKLSIFFRVLLNMNNQFFGEMKQNRG